MSYLAEADLEQFLRQDRLLPTDNRIDPTQEETVKNVVFGTLAVRWNADTWLDANTTPDLVVSVMAMLYCAWLYQSVYAESAEGLNPWGVHLEEMAMNLMLGMVSGGVDLLDADPIDETSTMSPSFYPTDAQNASEVDSNGNLIGSEIKFTIGMVF